MGTSPGVWLGQLLETRLSPVLSEETRAEIERLTTLYPQRRSALLPALRLAQREVGWLPRETLEEVADLVGVDAHAAIALTSFYDLFYTKPVGKYVLGVCDGLACHLCGSARINEYLSKKLGIQSGETTPDGLFTLRHFECLAACIKAPCMLLNDEYVGNLTEEKLDALLDELRARADGETPVSGGTS